MMKRFALMTALLIASAGSFAQDQLAGTTWKTIDDTPGKPRALIKFSESGDGLSGTIQQLLAKDALTRCEKCSGSLKNAPVVGMTVVHGLKQMNGSKTDYGNGTILDPKSGKTYKLKGSLTPDGRTFNLRGYIGIAALGRNQTWVRAD